MDFETVAAETFGSSLRGFGINLLVTDVAGEAAFLQDVFGAKAHRMNADFAIITLQDQLLQLHHDRTYHSNALLGLLPEGPPRGAGIELRLYDMDPDTACARAAATGYVILTPAQDKPHGLREAIILSPSGYAWLPSRPL